MTLLYMVIIKRDPKAQQKHDFTVHASMVTIKGDPKAGHKHDFTVHGYY